MANRNRNRGKGNGKTVANMNKKNYNKGNSTKNQRREKEAIDAEINVSKSNPYSWYDAFPQYAKDAGTLAFSLPLGQPIRLPSGDRIYIPGLMRFTFYPSFGYSADNTSPLNRSMLRFYTWLRNIQKAHGDYDMADVMMYLMTMDSLYMLHALCKRAYGVSQLFTPLNKYYPEKLFALMGFDSSILSNLAEFRQYINRLGINLAKYSVPDGIDLFSRHQWMCEGIYTDSMTSRAQTYFFVPEGFWVYNNTVATGSQLDFEPWLDQDRTQPGATRLHTLADLEALSRKLLNAIANDDDTGDIAGDLFTAYHGNMKKLEEVPEGLQVLPVYDRVVLSQIENMTIMGLAVQDTLVVKQNPSVNNGAIIFTPSFTCKSNLQIVQPTLQRWYGSPTWSTIDRMVNMHMDNPTHQDVIEATRFTVSMSTPLEPTLTANPTFTPDTYGADLIATSTIGILQDGGGMKTLGAGTQDVPYLPGSNINAAVLENTVLTRNFDWAPLHYLYTIVPDQSTGTPTSAHIDITYLSGELDNVTKVSYQQLSDINEAAMLSLFDVPMMGM